MVGRTISDVVEDFGEELLERVGANRLAVSWSLWPRGRLGREAPLGLNLCVARRAANLVVLKRTWLVGICATCIGQVGPHVLDVITDQPAA
jgi:hypothetical protein